jgi:outer membrane protein assembly factor BamB
VARPIPVAPGRIVFSSGYGVGSALLEIKAGEKWSVEQAWKTSRFQAKFSNPVYRDGFIYGVSDGIFACLDVADGAVKWKGGRFGHGQGLLVGEHYLQMTEGGELVLLKPTPEGEGELARMKVFDAKTWNTIALTGDLLLVRNDQEAACLRLPVK